MSGAKEKWLIYKRFTDGRELLEKDDRGWPSEPLAKQEAGRREAFDLAEAGGKLNYEYVARKAARSNPDPLGLKRKSKG